MVAAPVWAVEPAQKPIDVTSQQMEMLEKGKVAVFTGQVKVVQDNGILWADKVWHYVADDRLEAEGHVHYREIKDKEINDVYGGKMTYDRKKSYGLVTVDPRMIRTNPAKPDEDTIVTGDQVEIFSQEKRAKVTGHVNILQKDSKAKSDVADYYSADKKLVLTGHPWVWQKNPDNEGEYTGTVITVFTDTQKVIIEENVVAKITPVKKEKAE